MARATVPLLLCCVLAAWTADLTPDLLNAARKGQTAEIRAMLEKGVPVDSSDKQGRTALMFAAEHGRVETVSMLLEKGARPDARDKEGYDAWGLAFLSSSKGREKILGLMPAPARTKVSMEAVSILDQAYSSCFMLPAQLKAQIQELKPEAMVMTAVRAAAAEADQRTVELVPSGGDTMLTIRVRPGAACVQQQSADNVQLGIDVKLARSSGETIWEKTIGGWLKGMKARAATSPAQYQAILEEMAKADAGPVYSGMVAALLRK